MVFKMFQVVLDTLKKEKSEIDIERFSCHLKKNFGAELNQLVF